MRIAVFDSHRYDRTALEAANSDYHHELTFFEARLTEQTASLAQGFPAVCSFVNDHLDRAALTSLQSHGVRLIALRSAGYNHVDLVAASDLGMTVARVPEYSPHAVAEHAVALILGLNRKIPKAHARVREGNFTLDGLVGFDLFGKTVGIIGTGRIGQTFARIMQGFGCRVIASDPDPDPAQAAAIGYTYVDQLTLFQESDIISLHVPLSEKTWHLINPATVQLLKPGVMLINTGRGGLIDAQSLIDGLKANRIGAAGLDVYEEEEGIFFSDLSEGGVQDDVLARLMTFPNVLITAHQAFLTEEALANIANTTLGNVTAFERGEPLVNAVKAI
ncbi:MAG: 2-hydroxyacid dehydrogenase [Candidatus Sericytochromatia bacterium]|nr:2-hydroxyacid dehydrogenase [Candidatus Sericytochromatia bacterium]